MDLLSGDDGDSMVVPSVNHPINQTPRPCAGLKLQDLIQVVVVRGVAIHSSLNVKLVRQFSDNNYCYLLPVIITLWSMFAPLRPQRGVGSSPE